MRTDLTFSIIKPDSIKKGNASEILRIILASGFRTIGLKSKILNKKEAGEFYSMHKGKPFYDDLIEFMTSGEIYLLSLQKDNAVEDFRTLIGDTDPTKASIDTIRNIFGESVAKNAIHGADSDENAKREILFFFPELNEKYHEDNLQSRRYG
jgi:nucleoside-diphosphate kinase